MSNVKIVVVVAVDVSLLRIRGHSLASLGNLEMARFIDAQMQIAFASERIHDLLSWAYESRKVDRSGLIGFDTSLVLSPNNSTY